MNNKLVLIGRNLDHAKLRLELEGDKVFALEGLVGDDPALVDDEQGTLGETVLVPIHAIATCDLALGFEIREQCQVIAAVLRKGQEQKISVKLLKKEMPKRHAFMPGPDGNWDFNFDGNGGHVDLGDLKERLRRPVDEGCAVDRKRRWAAATDGKDTLRYLVGDDTRGFIKARQELSDPKYVAFMRSHFREK